LFLQFFVHHVSRYGFWLVSLIFLKFFTGLTEGLCVCTSKLSVDSDISRQQ